MFKKISSAVFAATIMVSAVAQGASFNWGVHDALESKSRLVAKGSFLDTYSFSILDALSLDSSVTVSNNSPPLLGISNGAYSLLSMGADSAIGGGDDATLGSWGFDGTTGSTQHFLQLGAGNYYFSVSGLATGTAGGVYSLSSTVAPIPEPETYAMLLAGLGLMGFVIRRRRASAG